MRPLLRSSVVLVVLLGAATSLAAPPKGAARKKAAPALKREAPDEPDKPKEKAPEPEEAREEKRPALALAPMAPPADKRSDDPSARGDEGKTAAPALLLAVGPAVASRSFSYSDAVTPNLRPYRVSAMPGLGGSVEVYPAAPATTSFAGDLGLVGRGFKSTSVEAAAADGPAVSTSLLAWDAGVRARFFTGARAASTVLGVEATYGQWRFAFHDPGRLAPELPDASYQHVRLGADAAIPVGPLELGAGLGYRQVLASGAFASRFRTAHAGGVDGRLWASLPIASAFSLQAEAGYLRYFHSFGPAIGDTYVAGGAIDQSFTGRIALAVRL